MLYYIPFEYTVLNEPTSRKANARLIVDLPQQTLRSAQRNLLVRDLVRHPQIRACYHDNADYKSKPESIVREFAEALPEPLHKIRVVYQRDPDMQWNSWQEFVLYIFMDNYGNGDYLPFRELTFTCRGEFPAYREAFTNDLLVRGAVWRHPHYEKNNLLKVYNGNDYDLAIVDEDTNGQPIVRMIANAHGEIPIKPEFYPYIQSIDLTHYLMPLLEARWMYGNLYGVNTYWQELVLTNQQGLHVLVRIVSIQNHHYMVVDDSSKAEGYRLEYIYGIDGLQRAIKHTYGDDYVPSKIYEIEQYIKNLHRTLYFITTLPDFIESFGEGADYDVVLDGIVKKYKIETALANLYLSGLSKRGYINKA